MLNVFSDSFYMEQAIKEAQKAMEEDEVPVGAVIVSNNMIIARTYNQVEKLKDPSAHAELLAITAACSALGAKWLSHCTMFVTLEPCLMCAGALYWSRIGRLVYGASDDLHGFMRHGKTLLHPQTKLEYGIHNEVCSSLMATFFEGKRRKGPS